MWTRLRFRFSRKKAESRRANPICSSIEPKAPIILFDYQPSRSGEHVAAYLKNFKDYVHSDRYSRYNKLKEITRCGCRTHLRRKFVEALSPGKSDGR